MSIENNLESLSLSSVPKQRIKYSKAELLALKDAPLSKRKPNLVVTELYLNEHGAAHHEPHHKSNNRGRGSSRGGISTRGKAPHKSDRKQSWQTAEVQKTSSTNLEADLSQEESSRRKEFEEFRKQYNNYKADAPKQVTTTTAPQQSPFMNLSNIPSEEDLLAKDFLLMDDIIGSHEDSKPTSSKLLKFFQPETKPKDEPVHPLLAQMLQQPATIPVQQQAPPTRSAPVFQDVDALEAELLKAVPTSNVAPPPSSVHTSFDANSFFKQYQAPVLPQHHTGHALSYAQATQSHHVPVPTMPTTTTPIPIPNKTQQQPMVQQMSDSPKQKKRLVPAQTIKANATKQPAGKQVPVDQLFGMAQHYTTPAPVPMNNIMSIEDLEKEFFK